MSIRDAFSHSCRVDVIVTTSVFAAILLVGGALLSAQAIDCSKARGNAEKLVCATPELRDLDEQLGREYLAALASAQSPASVVRIQFEWKKVREKCQKGASETRVACTADLYRTQIQTLAALNSTTASNQPGLQPVQPQSSAPEQPTPRASAPTSLAPEVGVPGASFREWASPPRAATPTESIPSAESVQPPTATEGNEAGPDSLVGVATGGANANNSASSSLWSDVTGNISAVAAVIAFLSGPLFAVGFIVQYVGGRQLFLQSHAAGVVLYENKADVMGSAMFIALAALVGVFGAFSPTWVGHAVAASLLGLLLTSWLHWSSKRLVALNPDITGDALAVAVRARLGSSLWVSLLGVGAVLTAVFGIISAMDAVSGRRNNESRAEHRGRQARAAAFSSGLFFASFSLGERYSDYVSTVLGLPAGGSGRSTPPHNSDQQQRQETEQDKQAREREQQEKRQARERQQTHERQQEQWQARERQQKHEQQQERERQRERAEQQERHEQQEREIRHEHWSVVLGVTQTASSAEIKRAYLTLVSQYHPDKVAHLGPELKSLAENKTKQIISAYHEATGGK